MITHVVLFKLKAGSSQDAAEIRTRVLGMKGQIPGLLSVEAGIDYAHAEGSYDMALITRHESREAFSVYQDHPLHQQVKAFIVERCDETIAVDFDA